MMSRGPLKLKCFNVWLTKCRHWQTDEGNITYRVPEKGFNDTKWQGLHLDVIMYEIWSQKDHKKHFAIWPPTTAFPSTFPISPPLQLFPPVPTSAVCYNWQIRTQAASWRGEMWHKAAEPYVSTNRNHYNRRADPAAACDDCKWVESPLARWPPTQVK